MRPEANFPSLEALVARIHMDASEAREVRLVFAYFPRLPRRSFGSRSRPDSAFLPNQISRAKALAAPEYAALRTDPFLLPGDEGLDPGERRTSSDGRRQSL